MLQIRVLLRVLLVLGTLTLALPAVAQKADAPPKPDTYLCPDTDGGAVECYLKAVEHLYTMCRQVKSIEIIEFGYEKSDEGVNGAKSEYCVDKHRQSITRPYNSALREAKASRTATDALHALQELWLAALADLKWKVGENDEAYKLRISKPYEVFRERAILVRDALLAPKTKAPSVATQVQKKGPN